MSSSQTSSLRSSSSSMEKYDDVSYNTPATSTKSSVKSNVKKYVKSLMSKRTSTDGAMQLPKDSDKKKKSSEKQPYLVGPYLKQPLNIRL